MAYAASEHGAPKQSTRSQTSSSGLFLHSTIHQKSVAAAAYGAMERSNQFPINHRVVPHPPPPAGRRPPLMLSSPRIPHPRFAPSDNPLLLKFDWFPTPSSLCCPRVIASVQIKCWVSGAVVRFTTLVRWYYSDPDRLFFFLLLCVKSWSKELYATNPRESFSHLLFVR